MQTSICPSSDELKAYLRGKLDSQQSDLLSQHMLHCEACERTIVEIEAEPDTLVELLKCELPKFAPSGDASAEIASLSAGSSSISSPPLRQPIQSPADGLQMPIELGQYELLRRLGTGGMGAVYLARHKSLDKQVAIKLLPALPAQHPGFLARFQREMRAAGKLDHPAIVRTTDAGELQGIHFLVMDAIDGMDLGRLLRVEEKMSLADACEMVRQAAIGLAHAHEKGIVHRDVKPSNLMLDIHGQVRILDFGLAQVGLWDSGSAEITTVGQLMGTLDYMAPEQAERGGAVDYRADLYSLGATLFRLLTGRAPLAAAPNLTPLEKLRLLATHKPPKLRSLRTDVPESLSQIVDAMLAREPAQRPASATHAAELLEPFGAGADLVGLLARACSKPQVDEASFVLNPLLQRDLTGQSRGSDLQAQVLNENLSLANTQRSGSGPGWLTWVATAAGFLAMLVANVLFVLETSKGQLVIDSQADVQVKIVAVDESGKRSDVDDLQISPGSKATRLKSGKYEIILDAASDSFGITNGTFTIRNGQTVVATITPKPKQANQEIVSNTLVATEDLRLNEVVYDGQTLDTWLRRLKFERSLHEVERSLNAIEALAEPSLSDVMLEPLVEFSCQCYPQHYGSVTRALRNVCGLTLPMTSVRILSGIRNQEYRILFLQSVIEVIDSADANSFSELLVESKKMLASGSVSKSLSIALCYRRLTGGHVGNEFSEEVRKEIVQMFVDTPSLTDANFWLAFPDNYADASGVAIRKEIFKRAIKVLADSTASDKLKSQAMIVLGTLFGENVPVGRELQLSKEDRGELIRILSTEISNLAAHPSEVATEVDLPLEFANYNLPRMLFPPAEYRNLHVGNSPVKVNPSVVAMNLIDQGGFKEELKSELQSLHRSLSQLPIGSSEFAELLNNVAVLHNWSRQKKNFASGSFLGAVVYLQVGTLLGQSRNELIARFHEKQPADLQREIDLKLDELEFNNRLVSGLDKLPIESSARAGQVLENALVNYGFVDANYVRLWIRATGEDFCSSYARVLDKISPSLRSLLLGQDTTVYSELRCTDPEKLKSLLSWCDAVLRCDAVLIGAEEIDDVAWTVAHMLRNLANSESRNFSSPCQELIVEHLSSYRVLDKTNFWFNQTLESNGVGIRIASVKKAIGQLARSDDSINAVDCQALVIIGQSSSEDWKGVSPELQEKFIDALRMRLESAAQKQNAAAQMFELPPALSSYGAPQFALGEGKLRSTVIREPMSTNDIILIHNLMSFPQLDLTLKLLEKLRPQVEALHEAIAKLNLMDPNLSDSRSRWDPTRFQRLNELVWHTWYTQSGVLLGKPYDELYKRPLRLYADEQTRKQRFVQPGDTLAIYIPLVLPQSGDPPVIQAGKGQPITGFPVPVSSDGTIQLPLLEPLQVKDMELSQVVTAIEASYTTNHKIHKILFAERSHLGITVHYLLRAGQSLELRNIAGSQTITVPNKQ